jgi:hypothetical protein
MLSMRIPLASAVGRMLSSAVNDRRQLDPLHFQQELARDDPRHIQDVSE